MFFRRKKLPKKDPLSEENPARATSPVCYTVFSSAHRVAVGPNYVWVFHRECFSSYGFLGHMDMEIEVHERFRRFVRRALELPLTLAGS
jgi:hypothetical protein